MEIQLGEIVGNQEEGFFAAFRSIAFRQGQFSFDIATGFVQSFGEQRNIFVRPLDVIKRRFGFVAHYTPFKPPAPRQAKKLRIQLFSHRFAVCNCPFQNMCRAPRSWV